MKKSKLIYSLSLVLIAGALIFTSCKKSKAFKEEDGQSSTDNRNVQTENDLANNDINKVISENSLLHGRAVSASSGDDFINKTLGINANPYTIDTNGAYMGTIKVNYNGVTEGNRTRTGSIKLTIQNYSTGKRWKQAGCVLQVDYLGYKVTRASDGKSIELNGTQLVTNETGGSWVELFLNLQSSLATSVTGSNLNVTFDGDKTAVYNINRRFTYTFPSATLTCKGEGIGSDGNLSGLENYGTTRDGDTFTSQVTTPIVWTWTCGWYAPVQGEVNIKVADKDFSLNVLFSVDKSGNAVTAGANSCPYGWKVEWTHKNKTKKKVFG